MRGQKYGFNRKQLFGQSKAPMSSFSVGTTLAEIERELSKTVFNCLTQVNEQPQEALLCLKMIDKILPQDLSKLIRLVQEKYVRQDNIKEIAATKCLVDFRLKVYETLGDARKCR